MDSFPPTSRVAWVRLRLMLFSVTICAQTKRLRVPTECWPLIALGARGGTRWQLQLRLPQQPQPLLSISGDDRSLSSSSSEASHSDVSASSRLTAWPEQSSSSASTSQEGPGLVVAQAPGEAALGAWRPPPKPLRPRQLQEVGRQSSSDSGIATGSHSSYSGSFSSVAGSSLDVWRAGDEFGSLLSLLPAAGAPEPSLCACPPGTAEYQVPSNLRPHYDTPRSLRQAPRDQTPATQGSPDDTAAGDLGSQTSMGCPSGWLSMRRRGQVTEAPGSEAVLPSLAAGGSWEAGGPHAGPPPAFFSTCPVCGGLKVNPPP